MSKRGERPPMWRGKKEAAAIAAVTVGAALIGKELSKNEQAQPEEPQKIAKTPVGRPPPPPGIRLVLDAALATSALAGSAPAQESGADVEQPPDNTEGPEDEFEPRTLTDLFRVAIAQAFNKSDNQIWSGEMFGRWDRVRGGDLRLEERNFQDGSTLVVDEITEEPTSRGALPNYQTQLRILSTPEGDYILQSGAFFQGGENGIEQVHFVELSGDNENIVSQLSAVARWQKKFERLRQVRRKYNQARFTDSGEEQTMNPEEKERLNQDILQARQDLDNDPMTEFLTAEAREKLK